ncbi:hypothetical protein [Porphyromonas asaccharolytica]|jgi:hypothetical protein|uniref:hypothetical protein n=1 Tax=Porphyromonas asaccharolytica TaxID=28123 RepID=UPI00248F0CCD|nr:hypothetical protein [Porphyromonas asaccharolytica]
MITIRDLLRYERLLGRSIFADEPDGATLIYCTTTEAYTRYTLDEWSRTTLGASVFMAKEAKELARELASLQQYSGLDTRDERSEVRDEKSEVRTLTDVVTELLTEGVVPADYLLERAELWELTIYIEATQRKRQQRLERQRLWSYMGLLPHIDSKKIKRPEDLIPFSWDEEIRPAHRTDEDTTDWNEARLRAFSS